MEPCGCFGRPRPRPSSRHEAPPSDADLSSRELHCLRKKMSSDAVSGGPNALCAAAPEHPPPPGGSRLHRVGSAPGTPTGMPVPDAGLHGSGVAERWKREGEHGSGVAERWKREGEQSPARGARWPSLRASYDSVSESEDLTSSVIDRAELTSRGLQSASHRESAPSWQGDPESVFLHDLMTIAPTVEENVLGMTPESEPLYHKAVEMCLDFPLDWKQGYSSKPPDPPAKVFYKINQGGHSLWFHVVVQVPYGLVDMMAPNNELETWPDWHPACTKHEPVGEKTAFMYGSYFTQSMMFGAIKTEQNTRTRRWINTSRGYMVTYCCSEEKGGQYYVSPRISRDQVECAVLFLPQKGPTPSTLVSQRVFLDMPCSIPSMLVKMVMNSFTPKCVKEFVKCAALAQNPKKVYRKLIDEDRCGIYAKLRELEREDAPRADDIILSVRQVLGLPPPGPPSGVHSTPTGPRDAVDHGNRGERGERDANAAEASPQVTPMHRVLRKMSRLSQSWGRSSFKRKRNTDGGDSTGSE